MPIPATLNTNEVKDAAGTEIEFVSMSQSGRGRVLQKSGETPALPHRLLVDHQEIGAGLDLRRRSRTRFDYSEASGVDPTRVATSSFYIVGDIPVGLLTSLAGPTKCLANLTSFVASKGASTTILYDGTGYGAEALLNGSL